MFTMLSIHARGLAARVTKTDEGATMVEYGIMVAAIAAVLIAIVFVIGDKVNDAFGDVSDGLDNAPPST